MAATIHALPTRSSRAGFETDDRGYTQKLEGLRRANEVRVRHARLKDQVRLERPDGAVAAMSLIRRMPPELSTMRPRDLLMAVTGIGQGACRKILNAVGGAAITGTFADLTPRQLDVLLRQVGELAERQTLARLEREGRQAVAA